MYIARKPDTTEQACCYVRLHALLYFILLHVLYISFYISLKYDVVKKVTLLLKRKIL